MKQWTFIPTGGDIKISIQLINRYFKWTQWKIKYNDKTNVGLIQLLFLLIENFVSK